MTPLQKFIQKDKSRIDAKIHVYFESFKKFICCKDLPEFDIQYTDGREDNNIEYKAQISLYHKPIILRFNIAALKENSNDFKYTLVHEFTHLYDYYVQSRLYTDEFIKNNMKFYFEYHAAQIEILFCYNIIDRITDIIDIEKIDFNTVLDLPNQKNEQYTRVAIKFLQNVNVRDFYAMKTTYMYACGASSILSQLLNRDFPPMNFIDPYKEEMKKIYELLSTIKYNEIPTGELLKQIGDIDSQVRYIWLDKK